MAIERVVVTGGNGRIGKAILEELNERGYYTIDVSRGKRREEVSDEYRTTDLLSAGEVYGSLAASDADAIIHMGTIPGPGSHPEHVTYESSVMSTYHVLEAASALDHEAVVLASSINVIGYTYQDPHTEIEYLPVDEDHELTPRDPYATSKHAMEVTADGYGRRDDTPQIVSLRYPFVGYEDEIRERYPATEAVDEVEDIYEAGTNDLFTYIHLEDGAAIAVDAIEADLSGHEILWAVAADTTVDVPTSDVVEAVYPDVPVRREFDEFESLIDISKATDLLDWKPEYSWRDV
ncbi:NAD-dependent epimerase/dehydratase family protein [Haloarcula marina]|uniref:NAD-dependent epimerase/dehydratase family protein n=1 Tax=Haloarcula marina TaxID=2961574 RepID=UPI0020B852A6|nr:NAD(P)-dependent oxidoreductase [Halomicroarcula marina]